ncbi:TlpA family protein disulfide reductase [Actinomadura sp. HBU206391]|uniref:TlpA family protein disulfide reductase n=1 Tax=Actinomadura sp. HBU206391 TaxID=2731692 RepID=UPI00164F7AF9|nr:TlpA disulfide reductase family protein [Actinomadura sp. HBU206391]MBC6459728.1 TlpA family protein disulfide reductase [Actinomadura sp. HBU206391]
MPYLVAAMVFVCLLVLLDLVLTLAVVRRLREHGQLLASGAAAGRAEVMPLGAPPRDFTAADTGGRRVSPDTLTGPTVVAFFSPSCAPCLEKIPRFVDQVRGLPGDHRVLVVMAGADEADAPLVARLDAVAQVILEPEDGLVANAFQTRGLPSMCLLDESGVIVAAGRDIDDLMVPAAA